MSDGIIITFAFTCSLILHIVIHRVLLKQGVVTIKSVRVYIIGLAILIISFLNNMLLLPLSSFVLYGLITLVMYAYYLGLCHPAETPAGMILRAFARKKTQTLTELTRLFTVQGLLWNRIDQLVVAGLVSRKGERFFVTAKGGFIARCIWVYQKFFNRLLGG